MEISETTTVVYDADYYSPETKIHVRIHDSLSDNSLIEYIINGKSKVVEIDYRVLNIVAKIINNKENE